MTNAFKPTKPSTARFEPRRFVPTDPKVRAETVRKHAERSAERWHAVLRKLAK